MAKVSRPQLPETTEPTRQPARLDAEMVGELFNRLRFHLQQAWFFTSNEHIDEAERVSQELGRRARALVLPAGRDRLEGTVRDAFETLKRQIKCESHAVEIQDSVYTTGASEGLPLPHLREELLSGLFAFLERLRKTLTEHLAGEELSAFRLGEIVDQGVAPADVHLDLGGGPVGRARAGSAAVNSGPTASGGPSPFRLGGAAVDQELAPATRSWRPRELLPRSLWWEDVGTRWNEALPRIPLPRQPGQAARKSLVGVKRYIKQLGQAARDGLASLERLQIPTLPLTARVQIDHAGQAVTLDSERWVCKHPEEFRIFCRLFEAGGDRVSGADLNRLPGCKGRPDKIIAKLPPALKKVVHSDDGRGGGYWIQLPPNLP